MLIIHFFFSSWSIPNTNYSFYPVSHCFEIHVVVFTPHYLYLGFEEIKSIHQEMKERGKYTC